LGPARVRAAVHRHLDTVLDLCDAVGPSQRRDVLRLTSETSELAGWLAFDSGQPVLAEVHYRRAIALAEAADDPALQAWAMGNLGRTLTSSSRGSEATGVLEAARTLAVGVRATRLASWLAAAAAWDHARGGRRAASARALATAEQLLDQPDPYGHEWISFYGYSQLDKWAGRCHGLFGQNEAAARSFRTSLRLLPSTLVRERASTLTDLADSYSRQGEIDAACASLIEAFTVARRTGSRRVESRVEKVRAAFGNRPSAGCLRKLDAAMAS